jgi:hypothetical protein
MTAVGTKNTPINDEEECLMLGTDRKTFAHFETYRF